MSKFNKLYSSTKKTLVESSADGYYIDDELFKQLKDEVLSFVSDEMEQIRPERINEKEPIEVLKMIVQEYYDSRLS